MNRGLSTLLEMAREVESGQMALQTRQGNDTVAKSLGRAMAEQVMPKTEAMAPAGMRNALMNAGIAGQIQTDKMADIQKALQQMAARQAQAQENAPPIDMAGIAAAPGAQTVQMAEGGIAGYTEGGSTVNPEFDMGATAPAQRAIPTREEGDRIADLIIATQGRIGASTMQDVRAGRYGSTVSEARGKLGLDAAAAPKPAADLPITQAPQMPTMQFPRASVPQIDLTEARNFRKSATEQFEGMDMTPVTSEAAAEQYGRDKAVYDALMRAEGMDPNFVAAAAEDEKRRTAAKTQRAQEVIDRVTGEQKKSGLIDFLLGASGFQGEGLGQVLKSGALSSRAAQEARQNKIDQMREAQLGFQDASAKEQFLLNKLRQETMLNRFDKARDTLQDLKKAQNDKRAAGIRMYTAFAGTAAEEGIARAQMQSRADAANAGAASRMIAAAMRGAGGKPPSIKDVKAREDMVAQNFFSPMAAASPVFRRFVPPEVINDISAGRIKFKDGRWIGPGDKPVTAIERAAQLYERALLSETSRGGGGGPTPYTKAESELDED